ncbi:MAG: hypothetical protein CL930_13385 [Deltaproteobacteria bacterium]|nr:hypothetical protein [Deltaproteobacteria bacterium]
MVFFSLLIGMAWAECDVVETASTNGKRDRREWEMTVADGDASCRRLVLGSVMAIEPIKLRVLIEQSDATQKRFNLQRVRHENGEWILYLPELRNGDWSRARLSSKPVESNPLWFNPQTRSLPDADVTSVQLHTDDDPRFGPYGTVSSIHSLKWETLEGPGVWAWFAPSNATGLQCHFEGERVHAKVDRNAYGCLFELKQSSTDPLVISWTQEGASSAGEVDVPGAGRLHLAGAEFSILGMNPESEDDGLLFRGPGTFSYRVTRMNGVLVSNTVIDQMALDANAVSIPEPGIGLQFKDRRADMSALPEVLQIVHQQTVNGELPGTHSLHPRPLMKVRRSRWGTDWEQALLLVRYLQQLRLEATAYPVRPQSSGLAEAGAPVGYTGAVVRVGSGADAIWMDPSCAVCAVGEISPELWGGQVLAHDLDQLPSRPESERSIQTIDGKTTVKLSGVYAVELRQWLAAFPVQQRQQAIMKRYAGHDFELTGIDGLTQLGAPIRLELQSLK